MEEIEVMLARHEQRIKTLECGNTFGSILDEVIMPCYDL